MTATPDTNIISKLKTRARLALVVVVAFAATWLAMAAQDHWFPQAEKTPPNLPVFAGGGGKGVAKARDIPLPPGSRPMYPPLRKSTKAGEWFQGWFATPQSSRQVIAFYRRKLAAAGWKSANVYMEGLKKTGGNLVFMRGNSRVKISVKSPEPGREGSEMWISLESRATGGRPVLLHEKM